MLEQDHHIRLLKKKLFNLINFARDLLLDIFKSSILISEEPQIFFSSSKPVCMDNMCLETTDSKPDFKA